MAQDEYDMYLGEIYALLLQGASVEVVSGYLRDVATKRMGFSDEQVPEELEVATALKAIELR